MGAFETLKKALITAPVVQPPIWNLSFEIMCDASKTLDSAQWNYATTKKEFLAVVFACDKFRSYIIDSKVIVHTIMLL